MKYGKWKNAVKVDGVLIRLCEFEGCTNYGDVHSNYKGKKYRRPFCGKHKKQKFGMTPVTNYPDAELAWMAGFFDGEGCVMIEKEKESINCFTVKAMVGNTHYESVKRIHARFNGWIGERKLNLKNPNHRNFLSWSVDSMNAIRFLKAIYKYSFTKKTQIEYALEAMNIIEKVKHKHRKSIHSEVFDRLNYLADAIKKEKKVMCKI